MAYYKVSDNELTSIADAIRTKGSTNTPLLFPDEFLTAIENISTGESPTLITKSITQNGTYTANTENADGYSSVTIAVPQICITGSFIGETAGSVKSINIPYNGNGYPIAGIIYPSHGTRKTGDSITDLVQKYVEVMYSFTKIDMDTEPSYKNTSASQDNCTILAYYKYSDSDPSVITTSGAPSENLFRTNNAGATPTNCVKIHSATSMTVYIANTSYGFANNIEYTYKIIYSS